MKIDRRDFRMATGFWPEHDDLDRCNCDKAGHLGHFMCGWDDERNLPNFWPKYPLQGAVTAQHRKNGEQK